MCSARENCWEPLIKLHSLDVLYLIPAAGSSYARLEKLRFFPLANEKIFRFRFFPTNQIEFVKYAILQNYQCHRSGYPWIFTNHTRNRQTISISVDKNEELAWEMTFARYLSELRKNNRHNFFILDSTRITRDTADVPTSLHSSTGFTVSQILSPMILVESRSQMSQRDGALTRVACLENGWKKSKKKRNDKYSASWEMYILYSIYEW